MTEERGLDPQRVKQVRALADEDLVNEYLGLVEGLEAMRGEARLREVELLRRMEEQSALRLNAARGHVDLKYGSPSYDTPALRPLLELITHEEMQEAYSHEREETVTRTVPERWNGTKLNMLERRYGGQVADVIQRARAPGAPRLTATIKESGDESER